MTNKSLEQNLQERFFSKLPLLNTYLASEPTMTPNGIRGYMNYSDTTRFTDDVSDLFDPSIAWAAGGLVSDINDVKN